MRTKQEIKNSISSELMSNSVIQSLYGINPEISWEDQFSLVSFENILVEIIAFCIFIHEQIFLTHKKELEDLLLLKKPHTARWYAGKAKEYQHGFKLLPESDLFDNTGKTDTEVAASKIIRYSAVTESTTESRLILKIATENGGLLSPLTDDQREGFEAFLAEVKDAGVKITVINYRPDKLALNLKIFRDAKIMDKKGVSILKGNEPVKEAISAFMKELPFNGELVLNALIDKLQAVPGVVNPHLVSAQTKWINPAANDYGNYEWINISKIPESGYFEIDWDNTIIEYIKAL